MFADVPGAPLVGAGEGRQADRRAEAGVVALGGNRIQTSDQVAQALAAGQLGEGQSTEPLGAVELAHAVGRRGSGRRCGRRPPKGRTA